MIIYLGFYVTFNSVQVISQRVVLLAKETSTYSWSRFCTVNCRPTASNYQLSHLRSGRDSNSDLRGGRRVSYHCTTTGPLAKCLSSRRYHWQSNAVIFSDKELTRSSTNMKKENYIGLIYLFGVLRPFQHCIGLILTVSSVDRRNRYIQLVNVLYCKLLAIGKQLPTFPHRVQGLN